MPHHNRGKTHKKKRGNPLRANATVYVPRGERNHPTMNNYLEEIRNVTTRNRNNSKSMEKLLREINAKRRHSLNKKHHSKGGNGHEHLLSLMRRTRNNSRQA